jgi:hypothetical protein
LASSGWQVLPEVTERLIRAAIGVELLEYAAT